MPPGLPGPPPEDIEPARPAGRTGRGTTCWFEVRGIPRSSRAPGPGLLVAGYRAPTARLASDLRIRRARAARTVPRSLRGRSGPTLPGPHREGGSVASRHMPSSVASLRTAAGAALMLLLVSGCGGGRPLPSVGPLGLGPTATFPSLTELDVDAACVTDADPANGGEPPPPDGVTKAGDPADPTGVVAIEVVGVGDLVLPSDELFAADLFGLGGNPADFEAIDLEGFTGSAPACLHVALYEPADERVAFVHVRLSDEPVTTWRETAGFGVDGGTGGLGSAEAVVAVGSSTEGLGEQYLDVLEQTYRNTWSWMNITVDPPTGANVVGFSTGFGDGGYPVVVGEDVDGRPASVVIDHGVVPWAWLSRVGTVSGGAPGASPRRRPGRWVRRWTERR